MKLTIKQLKGLIKEQLEEIASDPSLLDAETLKELVRGYALDFGKPKRPGTESSIVKIENVIDYLYARIEELEEEVEERHRESFGRSGPNADNF